MRKILILIISASYLGLGLLGGLLSCVSEDSYQFGKLEIETPLEEGLSAETLIESTLPTAGSTDVDLATVIKVIFSQRIDKNTLTPETFIVQSLSNPVPGEITYEEATRTAIFKPEHSLGLLANYKVLLTTGIKTSKEEALAADYSWNFSTRDGVWETQAKELKWSNTAATNPQAAISDNGDAVVVWQQINVGTTPPYTIVARRYTLQNGWESLAHPVANAGPNCINPQVGIDEQGRMVVVWAQGEIANRDVYANTPGANGIWNPATAKPLDNLEGRTGSPQLAMSKTGRALAVWTQQEAAHRWFIFINQYLPEQGWNVEPKKISSASNSSFSPTIGIGKSDSAMAVWEQRRIKIDGDMIEFMDNIEANHLQGELSSWDSSTEQELTDTELGALHPQVAGDGKGNYLTVWIQSDGTRDRAYARYFKSETNAWESSAKSLDNGSSHAKSIQIAMNNIGDAVALWAQDDRIWARRYIADTGWEAAALKIDQGSQPAKDPKVALDDEGNIIATWVQDDDIWINRYSVRDGSWHTEQNIDDHDAVASLPTIAMNSQGQAILAWVRAGNILAKMFK